MNRIDFISYFKSIGKNIASYVQRGTKVVLQLFICKLINTIINNNIINFSIRTTVNKLLPHPIYSM